MTNKLSKLYRIPKININLPTSGQFYAEDFITFSVDGSLPIRAMTAKDELMLKSPDALLNGDCLVHIIESCVPEVKNARKLFAPDIEAILLGIFYASYGKDMEFKAECPACTHINDFEVEIRQILDTTAKIPYPAVIDIDLGVVDTVPTKLSVFVQPYTFETSTRQQLALFEHSKLLQVMGDDTASDEDKIKTFNISFKKMVDLKFKNVLDCIVKIELRQVINNETMVEVIDSREDIKDYVFNADNSFVDPVLAKVEELNASGINNKFQAKCRGTITESIPENLGDDNLPKTKVKVCGHEWEAAVQFNPVNFFVKGSSHSARLK